MVILIDRVDRDVYITRESERVRTRRGCGDIRFILFGVNYPSSLFVYLNGDALPCREGALTDGTSGDGHETGDSVDGGVGIKRCKDGYKRSELSKDAFMHWCPEAHVYYKLPDPYRPLIRDYPNDYQVKTLVANLLPFLSIHDHDEWSEQWSNRVVQHPIIQSTRQTSRAATKINHDLLTDVCLLDLGNHDKLIRDKILCDIHLVMRRTNQIWLRLNRDVPVLASHKRQWMQLEALDATSFGICINSLKTHVAMKYARDQQMVVLEAIKASGMSKDSNTSAPDDGDNRIRPSLVTEELINSIRQGNFRAERFDVAYAWTHRVPSHRVPPIQVSMIPTLFPQQMLTKLEFDIRNLPEPEIVHGSNFQQWKNELFNRVIQNRHHETSQLTSMSSDATPHRSRFGQNRKRSLNSIDNPNPIGYRIEGQSRVRFPRVLTVSITGSHAAVEPINYRLIRIEDPMMMGQELVGMLDYARIESSRRGSLGRYGDRKTNLNLPNNETRLYLESDPKHMLHTFEKIETMSSWAATESVRRFLAWDPPTVPKVIHTGSSLSSSLSSKSSKSSKSSFSRILGKATSSTQQISFKEPPSSPIHTTSISLSNAYDIIILYEICDAALLRHAYRFAKHVVVVTRKSASVIGDTTASTITPPTSGQLSKPLTASGHSGGMLERLSNIY